MHFKLYILMQQRGRQIQYSKANGSRHSLNLTYRSKQSIHNYHNYIFLFNSFLNLSFIILPAIYS